MCIPIKGKCHTNLDDYKRKKWPTAFAKVPDKGDRVRAEDGSSLVVCGITYYEEPKEIHYTTHVGWRESIEPDPRIEVELTKPHIL